MREKRGAHYIIVINSIYIHTKNWPIHRQHSLFELS